MPITFTPARIELPSPQGFLLVAALGIAVGLPTLIALNVPPSPTALNQVAAIAGWGLVLIALALHPSVGASRFSPLLRQTAPVVAALLLVLLATVVSNAVWQLPSALFLSAAAMVSVAIVVLLAGAWAPAPPTASLGFMAALLAAGALSLPIALLQVFAPDAADGVWVARSGLPGRSVGNLRQPNHLATLLLWSATSAVPLLEMQLLEGSRRRATRIALSALFALLLFGVVLSGSRTGLVGVAILVLWGALDARLSRVSRALLIATPLVCAASWSLLALMTGLQAAAAPLGAATRLGEGDASGGRFSIWHDTLALIAQNPWFGVGFGEFNFAWTLTPFPQRHPAFFDHTHNLPLQVAVELGLPMAILVLALLGWGIWQAFDRSRRVEGLHGAVVRTAFVMVLLMALHSQLEYPLWYAYFLLPTAFAWGLCLGAGPVPASSPGAPASAGWVRLAGAVLLVGAVATLWDYRRVAVIFAPGEDAAPLAERIAEGRRSWFFAHHADYALVTTADRPVALPSAFERAPHYLLDTRLMIAWAQALAARGEVNRAHHLAARLREFHNPGSTAFFAPCDDALVAHKPFQCQPPERSTHGWRDFKP